MAVILAIATPPVKAVDIQWSTVGDPGNAADTTGNPNPIGAVPQAFKIMTYEWTNAQYVAFLNAVDPLGSNPQGIYSGSMGTDLRGGISFTSGNANGTKYAVRTNMGDKPVNFVSWFDAARVSNWLHNGAQSYLTTGTSDAAPQNTGAYNVGTGTSGLSVTRSVDAKFWIPTENEWYKAAYYKGGGTTAGYWDYPTQSDTAPTAVTSSTNGIGLAGSTGNFANFNNAAIWNSSGTNPPNTGNVTTVGTNGGPSAYGAFDMAGNVFEWNEDVVTLLSVTGRGMRGGSIWTTGTATLSSNGRDRSVETNEINRLGFRLVTVPEPSTWMAAVGIVSMVMGREFWRRRRSKG